MNIIFKKIHIEGFMSIGQIDLDLLNQDYVLIEGINENRFDLAKSNGSGKSSIWEALIWCLTGTTMRGTKSVENINTDSGTLVELIFSIDDKDFCVTRTKNHNKYRTNLFVKCNGNDVSGKGIRDSQKILEQYIPELDSSILSSVIILGQGLPSRFTNNTPAGRKEVLEQLSKSDFMIEDVKLRIDKRKSELELKLKSSLANISKNEELVNFYQNQLDKETERMSCLVDQSKLKDNLQHIRDSINDLQTQLDLHKADQIKLEEEYNATIDEISKQYKNQTEKTNNINNLYKSQLDELNIQIATHKQLIIKLQEEIEHINSIKDTCPTCGQKLPNVFKPDNTEKKQQLQSEENTLNDIVNQFNDINNAYKNELQQANELTNKTINDLSTNKAQLKLKLDKLKILIDELLKEISSKTKIEYSISEEIRNYQFEKEKLEKTIEELKYNLQCCNYTIDEDKKVSEELNNHLDIVKKFDTIVKRDFRGYLLHNVINFINETCKDYCKYVLNSDLLNFSLDGNNISITYADKEYEMLSGGERQKLDLIVQFSIRDMLCKFLGFSCNMIVLDEIFDNLDSLGCEKVINMMSEKLTELNSIYIITHHSDELDIPADNYITIVKDRKGVSHLKQ